LYPVFSVSPVERNRSTSFRYLLLSYHSQAPFGDIALTANACYLFENSPEFSLGTQRAVSPPSCLFAPPIQIAVRNTEVACPDCRRVEYQQRAFALSDTVTSVPDKWIV
jgi:hypothetical protein